MTHVCPKENGLFHRTLLPVPGIFLHGLDKNPKPQEPDPYLFIEGMACLMDGAGQPLCQVMLLEASCHPYVSGMRTCIMPHAEHGYLTCNTYVMHMQNEHIRAVCPGPECIWDVLHQCYNQLGMPTTHA